MALARGPLPEGGANASVLHCGPVPTSKLIAGTACIARPQPHSRDSRVLTLKKKEQKTQLRHCQQSRANYNQRVVTFTTTSTLSPTPSNMTRSGQRDRPLRPVENCPHHSQSTAGTTVKYRLTHRSTKPSFSSSARRRDDHSRHLKILRSRFIQLSASPSGMLHSPATPQIPQGAVPRPASSTHAPGAQAHASSICIRPRHPVLSSHPTINHALTGPT